MTKQARNKTVGVFDATTRVVASELLNDRRAIGNHGFSGAGLAQWRKQRRAIRACLKAVAAGRRPAFDKTVRIYCPQTIANGGTEDGFDWVWETLHTFLAKCAE